MKFREPPKSGDPSNLIQDIKKVQINIHCCRYWWLSKWKHKRLSYPFWRLYYNFNKGAFVYYKNKVNLGPDKIILIPPFTPFSTDIVSSEEKGDFALEGGWIKSESVEAESRHRGNILHLFIHFNLAYPLDQVSPDIFIVSPDDKQMEIINKITNKLKNGSLNFSIPESMLLHNLIFSVLPGLSEKIWTEKKMDKRIMDILHFMDRNFSKSITNREMAEFSGMAVNSFARLFKNYTGISPIKYLTKLRIENACNLLYHTNTDVGRIAEESGYSDRYYFSKVFKKEMNISPVKYRKQFYLK